MICLGSEVESTLNIIIKSKYTTPVPVSGERGSMVSAFTEQANGGGGMTVEEEERTSR